MLSLQGTAASPTHSSYLQYNLALIKCSDAIRGLSQGETQLKRAHWLTLRKLLRKNRVTIGKTRAAYAQSFALWQQATIDFTRRDHSYCLFAPCIYIVVLRAHPVRSEPHIQRNATGEVAIIAYPVLNAYAIK